MNTDAEVTSLRAEVERLQAQLAASDLEWQIRARDEEHERRQDALDDAATHADDPEPKLPKAFIELIRQVDVARVKAITRDIHTRGYTIVPGLLDPEQVVRVRDGLEPMFKAAKQMFARRNAGNEHPQTIHVQNVLAKTRAADEVATLPLLRALVAGVLSHDFILNAGAVVMDPDPGCSPQGLHQDDGFYTMFARPRIPVVVTAAVALDDFTSANGATRLVPGSNQWPESRTPDLSEVVCAEMPAGSVLIWDGSVFHGGGGNTTIQPRRTLTLNYARGGLRTQFNQYLSVPRDIVLALAPELQADLGYHHSGTGLGGCEFADPLKYLQRMVAAGGDGAQPQIGFETR